MNFFSEAAVFIAKTETYYELESLNVILVQFGDESQVHCHHLENRTYYRVNKDINS